MSEAGSARDRPPPLFVPIPLLLGIVAVWLGVGRIDPHAKPRPLPRVNLETAPLPLLSCLPMVGPVMMERLDEARREGRLHSIEDLDQIRGIGPKTLERLKPYIEFSDHVDRAPDPLIVGSNPQTR